MSFLAGLGSLNESGYEVFALLLMVNNKKYRFNKSCMFLNCVSVKLMQTNHLFLDSQSVNNSWKR